MNEALIASMVILGLVMAMGIAGSVSRGGDRERIRAYFISRGERLLETRWDPWHWGGSGRWTTGGWGHGWGNDHNAWYRIRYIDREGNEHTALCRTSGTLVDFYDDSVVRHVDDPDQPSRAQEAENRLLREEEEKLARKPKPKAEGGG